jgi:hypothetical protein
MCVLRLVRLFAPLPPFRLASLSVRRLATVSFASRRRRAEPSGRDGTLTHLYDQVLAADGYFARLTLPLACSVLAQIESCWSRPRPGVGRVALRGAHVLPHHAVLNARLMERLVALVSDPSSAACLRPGDVCTMAANVVKFVRRQLVPSSVLSALFPRILALTHVPSFFDRCAPCAVGFSDSVHGGTSYVTPSVRASLMCFTDVPPTMWRSSVGPCLVRATRPLPPPCCWRSTHSG